MALNHIDIMGRICKDIELRRTPKGIPVASFTIACDRDFGEKETDFIEIVCWNKTAEFVDKYFAKGRMAVVSGRLQIRKWTDKDGNKRNTAEIVADNVYFGDSKRDAESEGSSYTGFIPNDIAQASAPASNFATLTGEDIDLPF